MTKHIRLDAVGGIAGDMFAAALLDLEPGLLADVEAALAACPLIEDVSVGLVAHDDGVLCGRHFVVEKKKPAARHRHVHWRDIRMALETAGLSRDIRHHALAIFAELAAAEARVHGCKPDAVTFHEVGAWDSIADIVAAATLIARIGAAGWTIGPLPLGGGRVETAHGPLPVPAPATAILLEGFAVLDDGIPGERVTPTGAAIVRHLCSPHDRVASAGRIAGTGHGFGSRKLPGASNCLRVLMLESGDEPTATDERIARLECEIDDQTPEDIAHGIEHLRADPDVLDVIQVPAFGKKGRMTVHLQVLARPAARHRVVDLIFAETRTIGVRHGLIERTTLARSEDTVAVDDTTMRYKRTERPGGATIKAEADDLAAVAGSRQRDGLRRRIETTAEKPAKEEP